MNRRRPVSHRRVSTHRSRYGTSNPPARRIAPLREGFQTKDLSGSLQGAGGVGGLLAVRTGEGSYYPAYDNNGNIVSYTDDSGAVVASYAYDAFGYTSAAFGPLASTFAHRFSTKPLDSETGLYYYGYRFYAPALGRWMNRDPIEEQGVVNIYSFVGNGSSHYVDFLGMDRIRVTIEEQRRKYRQLFIKEVFLGYDPCDQKCYYGQIHGVLYGSESQTRHVEWIEDGSSLKPIVSTSLGEFVPVLVILELGKAVYDELRPAGQQVNDPVPAGARNIRTSPWEESPDNNDYEDFGNGLYEFNLENGIRSISPITEEECKSTLCPLRFIGERVYDPWSPVVR